MRAPALNYLGRFCAECGGGLGSHADFRPARFVAGFRAGLGAETGAQMPGVRPDMTRNER